MPSTESRQRPAVLIAASQPELRDVLKCVLRDAAYDPTLAADGVEVVAAVVREAPDVLVLDVHLPRLDGLLALEIVRALAKDLPVVLMSSLASPGLGVIAERLGVVAVLRKPFRNSDLLEAIARAVTKRGEAGRAPDATELTVGASVAAPDAGARSG